MPWIINRTIRDVAKDHHCPPKVLEGSDGAVRAALEEERQRKSANGEIGIFEELRGCFGGNGKMPGFLQDPQGAGRFVIDIGLGPTAEETHLAVRHGFVVFSFDMLPANIKRLRDKVANDNRYRFVELQKDGGKWVVPDLPLPPSDGGFSYVFNAAISDEEMTVTFAQSQGPAFDLSINDGKKGDVEVPVLPLHKLLPKWLEHVEYLKIDTQGFELKVLRGCEELLQEGRVRYVTYEFSPWLMKRAKSGDPLELLRMMPRMGAICYNASPNWEHLRDGAPTALEAWYEHLDGGDFTGWGHPVRKNDPWGPWVDILCYWPFQTGQKAASEVRSIPAPAVQSVPEPEVRSIPPAASGSSAPLETMPWIINRTIRDVAKDHHCPPKVLEGSDGAVRAALEEERQRKSANGEIGIFEELRGCFGGNGKMPGFLQDPQGAGRFVIDIGLGPTAEETHLAVRHGFVVFSFDMLPANIKRLRDKVANDNRYRFVELQKDGGKWVVPDLPLPPSDGGFSYVFNAAISDEEMTVTFAQSQGPAFDLSINDGKKGDVEVPVLPLHKLLPKWLEHVEYLKIDTQGFELKVLRGCEELLQEGRVRYVTYEFSPWLMKRAKSGDPLELLRMMPRMGAICYNASPNWEHLRDGAPTALEAWYEHLDGGDFTGWGHPVRKNDPWGPWVDILCYWPFQTGQKAASEVRSIPAPAAQSILDHQSGSLSGSFLQIPVKSSAQLTVSRSNFWDMFYFPYGGNVR